MRTRTIHARFILSFILCHIVLLWGCAGKRTFTAPAGPMTDETVATAVVEAIDHDTREVTFKDREGKVLTLKVPEDVNNLDQVDAGDELNLVYRKSVTFRLEKEENAEPSIAVGQGYHRAPQGQKPKGVQYNVVEIGSVVKDINYGKRKVDLTLPSGEVITVKANDNMKNFENIKKGDKVVTVYSETITVSVK